MTKLSDKFPESALHVKIQSVSEEKKKGLAVLYVDARNVMDRLDDVVGSNDWYDEYIPQVLTDKYYAVECRLTINGVTKADIGEGQDIKSAYSDALKRAGVKFGIARYLYSSDTRWFDVEKKGRNWYFVESDQKIIHQLLGKSGAGTEKKETPKRSTPQAETQPFITEAQRKKLYAMTKAVNMTSQEAQDFLKNYGFSNSKEVTKDKFKDIVKELENMQGSDPSDAEMKAYADWSERIPEDEEAQKQFLDASRKRFFAFMKKQGMEGEDAKKYLKEGLGVDMSTNDILLDPDLRRKLNIKVFNETGEVLFG